MSEQELTQRDYANKAIDKGEALKRLQANPDFKLLIEEDFLKDGQDQLVKLLAYKYDEVSVKEISGKLQGIAFLKSFFDQIEGHAKSAADWLANPGEDK